MERKRIYKSSCWIEYVSQSDENCGVFGLTGGVGNINITITMNNSIQ